MTSPLLLSSVLLLSFDVGSDRPDVELAAESAVEAPDDSAEAPDTADADASAELPPELQAAIDGLDPAARQRYDAMDEAELEAMFERMQRGETLSAEEQRIADAFLQAYVQGFESELSYQSGDIVLSDGLATLHLGDQFRYLGPDDAERVLVDGWNNPPGPESLGMIVPADVSPLHPTEGWGIVITFANDGYVEDDDAEDIDYDDLLEQMQEGTEAENPNRQRQGYPAMHLVGWAEPPHYDADEHRLYWAKELSLDGAPGSSLNYAIRVLGRRGVLELNAVAGMDMLPAVKPSMEQVLSRVEFNTGHRYEDFDPDMDRVAAYGIGGLIAGKVLAKTGILAGLFKLLIAAKKLLIIGLVAFGVMLKRLFGRKED